MTLTRDGISLWLFALAALVGYLMSVGEPPTHWDYKQWLQFVAAVSAWGVGKLQASQLPSSKERKDGFRENGERL